MSKWIRYVAYIVVISWCFSASAGSYEDFFIAVGRDDGGTVTALVERGFDLNTRDPQGQLALIPGHPLNAADFARASGREWLAEQLARAGR